MSQKSLTGGLLLCLALAARSEAQTVTLQPAADACAEHGYDVVHAEERRETTGGSPEQQQFVRSEATVRCRNANPLFHFGHDASAPLASSAAPAPPPPATVSRCVPGASLACATPTCSGAQICAADGTRFGPCECAPPAAPSASAPDTM